MEIEFEYAVTKNVLNQEFVTSIVGPIFRSVTFNLSELSEQARKDLWSLSNIDIGCNDTVISFLWDGYGRPKDKVQGKLMEISAKDRCGTLEVSKCTTHYDHAVLTIAEVESKLAQMLEQVKVAISECEKHKAEYLRVRAEKQAVADAEEERIRFYMKEKNAKSETERKERASLLEEEKRNWIEQNGSERLRLAHSHGYECIRLYVSERAKLEYPSFILDLDSKANWIRLNNPSLSALKLVQELIDTGKDAQIVWLTRFPDGTSPDEDDYDDDGDSGDDNVDEAIVIGNFLGAYNLIKLM